MMNQFLDTPAVSEYLGVPVETLKQWRCRGKGPRYRKLPNGKVTYRIQDLNEFSESHMIEPSEAA